MRLSGNPAVVKTLAIVAVAWLLTVGLLSGRAFAADYYVATYGSDSTGNGSLPTPWATIQYAVGRVPDGSTIVVRPGTYTGRTRFTRHFVQGITVRSEVPYQAVLTSTTDHVITMYGSNVGPPTSPLKVSRFVPSPATPHR